MPRSVQRQEFPGDPACNSSHSNPANIAIEKVAPANQRFARNARFQHHTRKCTSPSVRHAPADTDQMTVTQLMGNKITLA